MDRRTLIVGDIHGCVRELGALIEQAAPTRLIVVGDLFTKGPDPVGVWRILKRWRAQGALVAVMGNHDLHALNARRKGPWRDLPPKAWRWLEGLPYLYQEPGLTVVHGGLHPVLGPPGTDCRTALHLRRWPLHSGEGSKRPFWWQQFAGPGLVVYGHDARRGLQDHRPRTLGLDTGCVYGGRLTGYLVEEDRLLTVTAARVYKAV